MVTPQRLRGGDSVPGAGSSGAAMTRERQRQAQLPMYRPLWAVREPGGGETVGRPCFSCLFVHLSLPFLSGPFIVSASEKFHVFLIFSHPWGWLL